MLASEIDDLPLVSIEDRQESSSDDEVVSFSGTTGEYCVCCIDMVGSTKMAAEIGEADMYVELQKQTEDMAKKYKQDIEGETGIASSISESDMKSYIKEVMVEIRKNKGEAV